MFKNLFSNFSNLCDKLGNSMNTFINNCQYQNSFNFQTGSTNKITVNGKTYSGKNVIINRNKVIIDGKETNQPIDEIKEITIIGDVHNLNCQCVTINGNVSGQIDSQKVEITGDVKGDIDAMSVDINGQHTGNIDAMSVSTKR